MIDVTTFLEFFGLDASGLQGYGPLLLHGVWVTAQLSALSLLVSMILGLLGAHGQVVAAAAAQSGRRPSTPRWCAVFRTWC